MLAILSASKAGRELQDIAICIGVFKNFRVKMPKSGRNRLLSTLGKVYRLYSGQFKTEESWSSTSQRVNVLTQTLVKPPPASSRDLKEFNSIHLSKSEP